MLELTNPSMVRVPASFKALTQIFSAPFNSSVPSMALVAFVAFIGLVERAATVRLTC